MELCGAAAARALRSESQHCLNHRLTEQCNLSTATPPPHIPHPMPAPMASAAIARRGLPGWWRAPRGILAPEQGRCLARSHAGCHCARAGREAGPRVLAVEFTTRGDSHTAHHKTARAAPEQCSDARWRPHFSRASANIASRDERYRGIGSGASLFDPQVGQHQSRPVCCWPRVPSFKGGRQTMYQCSCFVLWGGAQAPIHLLL